MLDKEDLQNLDSDQFHHWKEAAQDKASDKDLVELTDDLVSLAENGETMTIYDAKILGFAYELHDRVHGR